jgi:hypothetical protein
MENKTAKPCAVFYKEFQDRFSTSQDIEDELNAIENSVFDLQSDKNLEERCSDAKAIYSMRYSRTPFSRLFSIPLDDLEKYCLSADEKELLERTRACKIQSLHQKSQEGSCAHYYREFNARFCRSVPVKLKVEEMENSILNEKFEESKYLYF